MDEETQSFLNESNSIKADANIQFATGDFSQAISTYDRALASCPDKLDYEIAVLRSNIAACHIKLSDWKAAVESATDGLKSLDKAEGKPPDSSKTGNKKSKTERSAQGDSGDADGSDDDNEDDDDDDDDDDFQDARSTASDPEPSPHSKSRSSDPRPHPHSVQPPNPSADQTIVELDPDGDIDAQLRTLQLSDERRAQIHKLRVKLLLRRAKANTEQGGWSTLAAAETDYKEITTTPELAQCLLPKDGRMVRQQLAELPARTREAQEREVGEMMGKLKDLGNSFLKPFGLSTENFKMVKDEKTGGYSMNFDNGAGGGGGSGGGGAGGNK